MLVPAPSTALAKIVATERAFSHRCGEVGTRESFMRYFADDAVMFSPGPVNAQAALAKMAKGSSSLSWYPVTGDVAADGSLGYSSGPYLLTNAKTGRREFAGNFFSVWRRGPKGEYQVVLDLGAPIEPLDASQAPTEFRSAGEERGGPSVALRTDLLDLDRAYGSQSTHGEAVARFRGKGVRLYRKGSLPTPDAPEIAGAKLEGWRPSFADVALSGDLGYTYGAYQLESPAQSGWYVHVWRREAQGWRLAIEVLNSER